MAGEAKVRDPVVRWAKQRSIEHIRQSFRPGVKQGWPDDIFLIPGGRPYFIEFKAPGKRPTVLQEHRIATLQALGYDAAWFDRTDAACAALAQAVDRNVRAGRGVAVPGGIE